MKLSRTLWELIAGLASSCSTLALAFSSSVICLIFWKLRWTAASDGVVERGPAAVGPRADGYDYGDTNSKDDAEENGIFDEGRTTLVFVEAAKQSPEFFHFEKILFLTRLPVVNIWHAYSVP